MTHGRTSAILFILISTVFLTAIPLGAFANETSKSRVLGLQDFRRTEAYYQECESIKSWVVSGQYQAECYTNYHHFNSTAVDRYYRADQGSRWVEMAAFNLWHPGSNSSPYKDYQLIAKIMNSYDVVAALELLPSVGQDYEHNQRVRKFVEDGPELVEKLEQRYELQPTTTMAKRLVDLKADLKRAPSLYRIPDYLVLLDELRKLDPSWALILAPSGEAADEAYVQELVGFYYRAKVVKPIVNEHCHRFKKRRHGPAFACYPKLTKAWLGKSIREVFSRRPFLGAFESGDFDFTLVTSHIVFRSPQDPDEMASILKPSFGVEDYRELGTGGNRDNYARLAEMKIIMEIMQKLRAESVEKDIIFLGDTNLKASNNQWENVLSSFPGGELFIDTPTTLTMPLILSDGTRTNGLANDLDHIIMDTSETTECLKSNGKLSARVGNFLQGRMKKLIHKRYLYRKPNTTQRDPRAESKRQETIAAYRKRLEKRFTVKWNRVVVDDNPIEDLVRIFDERVFLSQLEEDNYYRLYKAVISDHLPVYFSCRR